jgi:hypothetical protein
LSAIPTVETTQPLTPSNLEKPADTSEQIQVSLEKLLHLATNSSKQAELITDQEVTIFSDLYRSLLAHNDLFDSQSLPKASQNVPIALRG